MGKSTLGLIGFLVLMVFYGGCKYNGMVKSNNSLEKYWNNVQSEYQRRSDLIPNLVEAVKGEANFEKGTLEAVVNARASATKMTIDPTNVTPEKMQEFQQKQGELSSAIGRLLMVTENYPNLKANQAFSDFRTQYEGTENRIKVARNDYNKAIEGYNNTVETFPSNIFAGMFGFKRKEGFKADTGSEKAPQVKF